MKTCEIVVPLFGIMLLLLLIGCAGEARESPGAPVVGVTDSTIVLGSWAPLTGPAAAWGAIGRGMDAYFKMVNDEGGIHGRKIRFILKDGQYQPARVVSAVKEMVERDRVFALVGGVGTASGMAVKPYLVEHGVPWWGVLSGHYEFTYPPEDNIFGGMPLNLEEGDLLAEYAINDLGKTRVGVIYQNDDYGQGGRAGTELALVRHGLEMADAVSVEVMDTDLSSQALRLKQSGADVVLLYLMPRHAAVVIGEAAKLGYRPQWLAPTPLSDAPLMHGITDGLWEGTIFSIAQEPADSNSPLMQRYRQAKARYAPEEREGLLFYTGFAVAEPLVEALRHAGRDLTREGLIEALAGLDGFKGLGPEISYGDNPRYGIRSVYLARCGEGGRIEPVTDWRTSELDIEAAIARLYGGA